ARTGPYIHCHVKHCPSRTRDQLDFLVRGRLKVQSAQRPAATAERDAPLRGVRTQPPLQENGASEETGKRSSFVFHSFKLSEKKPGNVQRSKQHCGLVTPIPRGAGR